MGALKCIHCHAGELYSVMAVNQGTVWGSVAGLGLLLGALIALGVTFTRMTPVDPNPVVNTTCGGFRGSYNSSNTVYTFKGVAYAQPPVGPLRWQPPEAYCNTGVHDATTFKAVCPQIDFNSMAFVGNEDCLYLDIYSPDVKGKKPVVVYIHGGSLQGGNSHEPTYSPYADLAREMDVVYVSIQYRLQAFGFLVTEGLPNRKGNYGLLDSIQALKWVQRHISNFGGDPENVSLMGASSGGTLVFALMTSSMAKGLFHKAWSSSGSPTLTSTYYEAVQLNSFFVDKVGCKNATDTEQCLMDLDEAVISWSVYPEWGKSVTFGMPVKDEYDYPLLIIDGEVLQTGFLEAFQKRSASLSDVPFMVGTTAQETSFGPDLPNSAPPLLTEWNDEIYDAIVQMSMSTFNQSYVAEVLSLYPADGKPNLAFLSLTSDVRVNCPSDVLAAAAADALESPVYRYIVTNFPSAPAFGFMNYAFHTWDIYAYFDVVDEVLFGVTPSQKDYAYAQNMRENVLSFLKSGRPSSPSWMAFPTVTALIDDKTWYTPLYHQTQCSFWNNHDFFKYGLTN